MLLFKPEHVPMILDGRKTQTRRIWRRRRAKPGAIHRCTTDRFDTSAVFADVRILRVWEERLGDISFADAQAEGYIGIDAYFEAFFSINRLRTTQARVEAIDGTVWCVEFERVGEADE